MDDPTPHLDQLPQQVLSRIFSFLGFCDRQAVLRVCTRWYQAAQDPQLQESISIRLSGNIENEILNRLGGRKIPNLKLIFGEDYFDHRFLFGLTRGHIDLPQIVRHTELVSNVKYLFLKGDFDKGDVAFCLQHFRNLKTLRMDQGGSEDKSFLGDVQGGASESLTRAMRNLSNVICDVPMWRSEVEICQGFSCFASVENVRIVTTVPSVEYLEQRIQELPTGETFIDRVLHLEGIVSNLRELDLRWCTLSVPSFRDLVNIPFRRLDTLRFCACAKKGKDLNILADSLLSPTTLEVVYRDEYFAEVGYPAVGNLVAKKPSMKSYKGVMMMYPPDESNDSSNDLKHILEEWQGMNELDIVGRNIMECEVSEISFHRKDSFTAVKIYTSSAVSAASMVALAEHSPGLKAIAFENPDVPERDFMGIVSIIVDSFSHLTTLVLFYCDLGPANVREDPDVSWAFLISRATQLEVLCLGYTRGVTDDHLVGLRLPNLRRLMLTNCLQVTDRAVASIASSNPTLQLLDLSGCTRITDESITSIASHLRHLRYLFLIDCKEITGASAVALSESCQMLEMVDVGVGNMSFERALKNQRLAFPYLGKIETRSCMKEHRRVCLSYAGLDGDYYI